MEGLICAELGTHIFHIEKNRRIYNKVFTEIMVSRVGQNFFINTF